MQWINDIRTQFRLLLSDEMDREHMHDKREKLYEELTRHDNNIWNVVLMFVNVKCDVRM